MNTKVILETETSIMLIPYETLHLNYNSAISLLTISSSTGYKYGEFRIITNKPISKSNEEFMLKLMDLDSAIKSGNGLLEYKISVRNFQFNVEKIL